MTKFERKVKRLGLSEDQLSTSVELLEWVIKHKERYYVPESFLSQVNLTTSYDSKQSAEYSLIQGTVIPTEPQTLEQL